MSSIRSITPQTARRLAVASQCLDQHSRSMLNTIRQIGCLQLDPTKAIIQNQFLVLWSRLGAYDMAEFDRLMWTERNLFEYWAHAASIVLTENYPIHRRQMQVYATRDALQSEWVRENHALKAYILEELRERGQTQLKELQGNEHVVLNWSSTGWTAGRNLDRMVDHLWTSGEVMVAGRLKGSFRVWDLAERVLPEWVETTEWDEDVIIQRAILIALNALGVGTEKQIKAHFTRAHYPNLKQHLKHLESNGQIQQVQIVEEGQQWAGVWYIANSALLERIEAGDWQPTMRLLSPFDNLICDRDRTHQLFDFFFRLEIYVPKDKRQYGYFVVPILDGDSLIGRIDPVFNRKTKTLAINAVHWEKTPTPQQRHDLQTHVANLAQWIGATQIDWNSEPKQS